MMLLNNDDLLKITGGSITATMLNAVVKGIQLLIDLGKGFGSTIRRVSENKSCGI